MSFRCVEGMYKMCKVAFLRMKIHQGNGPKPKFHYAPMPRNLFSIRINYFQLIIHPKSNIKDKNMIHYIVFSARIFSMR